jgi:hypothetical protein
VTLDWASAPWIPKRVRKRLQIVGHTGCQTGEGLQVAGCSVNQPLPEGQHVEVMQRSTKALNELVADSEQRIRG